MHTQYLVGIDEAGRGPLAGPVSVAAVAIPFNSNYMELFIGVDDSKKLSAIRREHFFKILSTTAKENDVRFSVAFSSAAYIDSHGITSAVQNALNRALRYVVSEPKYTQIFLDGSLHAPSEYERQKTIIGGDASVPIISLSSIAAKVVRDHLIIKLAKEYPYYAFEKNKGYGTRAHMEALLRYGPSAIHRRTFLRKMPADFIHKYGIL